MLLVLLVVVAVRCRKLISTLSWIVGGLFGLCLAPAWRRLGLKLWGAGKTTFSRSSVVPANQIEYAASEAQEKPLVSFL